MRIGFYNFAFAAVAASIAVGANADDAAGVMRASALMDARGLFDYLCVCQLIKQPIGEAVSNIINGRRCGRNNIGEEFTRIDTAGCNPVYSWLECYCKNVLVN